MIYLVVSLFFALISGIILLSATDKIVAVSAALMVGLGSYLINYFCLPVIGWNYPTFYIEMAIILSISLFMANAFLEGYVDNNAIFVIGLIALIGIALFIMVGLISTLDIFHYNDRRAQLHPTEVVVKSDNGEMSAATDIKEMCTVSEAVARRAILAKMGDQKNTYDVGHLTKQSVTCNFVATQPDGSKVRIKYNNHIIYVGVFEHRSFWAWLSEQSSPAYVIADASDASKVYIVTEVNGKPLVMKYTDEAPLWLDIERHMRNNGYLSTILDDFDVEIDENGRPYAPVTTVRYRTFMSTKEATGIALVDIQTGEIKQYTPQNAPAFVNMIQPSQIVENQINWWGLLKNWPKFWIRSGRVQACEGMDVVQTPEGSFFYVGVRAESDSVGTLGYMMVNTRTGKATYYKRSGISESEAVRVLSANPDVMLEMKSGVLELTEPIYYNVEGIGTYFSTYVSSSDFTVKYYAFASTTDKSVWGYGKTLEEARTNYLNSYYKSKGGKGVKFAEKQDVTTVEVQVLEKSVVDNVFYFRVKGYEDKVFKGTLSPEFSDMLWETTGKKVKISFSKTDSKFVELKSYEILH